MRRGLLYGLMLALPLLFFLGFGAHCQSHAGSELIDCSQTAVVEQIPSLMPAVIAILTAGGDNWRDQLGALEALGVGLIGCVVSAAITYLTDALGPASQPDRLKAALPNLYGKPGLDQGITRGKEYLAKRLTR